MAASKALHRFAVPVREPIDVKPHLGDPDKHWRSRYSAKELATLWHRTNDFPPRVRTVLDGRPDYRNSELVDGFFERSVDLKSRGFPSQTDLMLVVATGQQLAIIAVEGKVDEPFGDKVARWNDGSPTKMARLEGLCATLGIPTGVVGDLRYQLFHRTASAIYEAQRYRARKAMMLVHSFSTEGRWFDDFAAFSKELGIPVRAPGEISCEKACEGIGLRLGWVSDEFAA